MTCMTPAGGCSPTQEGQSRGLGQLCENANRPQDVAFLKHDEPSDAPKRRGQAIRQLKINLRRSVIGNVELNRIARER